MSYFRKFAKVVLNKLDFFGGIVSIFDLKETFNSYDFSSKYYKIVEALCVCVDLRRRGGRLQYMDENSTVRRSRYYSFTLKRSNVTSHGIPRCTNKNYSKDMASLQCEYRLSDKDLAVDLKLQHIIH
ncbi:hypothetical protein PHYBLDRAFT_64971 [Phycomyces blakesleeanus NRRL 1555(-)]|uniref:Uncharacterized protein n=1 Tax=Phycomyces blakesleeanus (strain ATCC 8743b / DSM 1359 / FGSC 10004 / NBRC 33097 / NRRL 1555) TaxID=763407 RepID=A0A162UC69_PHYB8|nr:hypothetical protein PHYBLDRAFT_64971 [Phycomyces blakesleeanus NRRL 1555(-)]OAD74023.1 hypothetical protein PHYBLDRAFT_64971 [Phycomyces blakesleeanus NRRL 1555(-)]|eukprot:XP_018292063.1 hypothetical protein PHYBLDRAFT_64971 [Phycomyces blakesleeanus NRRL 1555(-)]